MLGFYAAWPGNWRQILGLIFHAFSFSEREIWALPARRAVFWHDRAIEIYGNPES